MGADLRRPPRRGATDSTCPLVTSESSEHEDKSTDASGDTAPQSNPAEVQSEAAKEDGLSPQVAAPQPEEDDELGPLPDNWEMAYTEKGEVYFIE